MQFVRKKPCYPDEIIKQLEKLKKQRLKNPLDNNSNNLSL